MIFKPVIAGEDTDKVFYELNRATDNLKRSIVEHHPFFRVARWIVGKVFK